MHELIQPNFRCLWNNFTNRLTRTARQKNRTKKVNDKYKGCKLSNKSSEWFFLLYAYYMRFLKGKNTIVLRVNPLSFFPFFFRSWNYLFCAVIAYHDHRPNAFPVSGRRKGFSFFFHDILDVFERVSAERMRTRSGKAGGKCNGPLSVTSPNYVAVFFSFRFSCVGSCVFESQVCALVYCVMVEHNFLPIMPILKCLLYIFFWRVW